jgi:hypothetical protein
VTAGRQLKNICESWEFTVPPFLPYASIMFTHLRALIRVSTNIDTWTALLQTISVIIENLDRHIIPFAPQIVAMLPELWKEINIDFILAQTILTLITRLVAAMKADSLPLHKEVFPIILDATNPEGSEFEFILEDAMVSHPCSPSPV